MLATALLNKVPRPQFYEAFGVVARPYVDRWIATLTKTISQREFEEFKATLPDDDSEHNLTKLFQVLAGGQEKLDAFEMASHLKTQLGWPVDAELVTSLKTALERTPRELRNMTTTWMMKHSIRFDKKVGDDCVFYDPSYKGNRFGKVESIDRVVATGTVKVGGKPCAVFAEHVVS